MEAKSFAVGMRVEHPQHIINEVNYGKLHGNDLPAAPYKVTAQTSVNRGVYSFCMCPGGYVVNASSEEKRLVVNGMSYSDRAGHNANSAIIVQVTPDDFEGDGPLAGVEFQRKLEQKAYEIGQGKVPVQYFVDFVENRKSEESDNFNKPCIKGEYSYSNLRGLLPDECETAFIEGMKQFDKVIKGFSADDAILSGIESRTSSPVRIHRNENLQSDNAIGLYPCGEGAGYAGGIVYRPHHAPHKFPGGHVGKAQIGPQGDEHLINGVNMDVLRCHMFQIDLIDPGAVLDVKCHAWRRHDIFQLQRWVILDLFVVIAFPFKGRSFAFCQPLCVNLADLLYHFEESGTSGDPVGLQGGRYRKTNGLFWSALIRHHEIRGQRLPLPFHAFHRSVKRFQVDGHVRPFLIHPGSSFLFVFLHSLYYSFGNHSIAGILSGVI